MANPARYFAVDGLRSGFDFDDLIQSVAAWALEELNRRGFGHDAFPNSNSMLSHFERAGHLNPCATSVARERSGCRIEGHQCRVR